MQENHPSSPRNESSQLRENPINDDPTAAHHHRSHDDDDNDDNDNNNNNNNDDDKNMEYDEHENNEKLVQDDLHCYKTVVRLNECIVNRDWSAYASLFSPYEIDQAIMQYQRRVGVGGVDDVDDAEKISREKYISEIIVEEMEQDRGLYNNLVNYEILREDVVREGEEVMFVFRYTYLLEDGVSKHVEDEKLWCVKQSNGEWRVQFDGVDPFGFSALQAMEMNTNTSRSRSSSGVYEGGRRGSFADRSYRDISEVEYGQRRHRRYRERGCCTQMLIYALVCFWPCIGRRDDSINDYQGLDL